MPAAKVLIVDDAPLNRKLAELVLRKEGFEVQTASGAEEALARLDGFHPDLILMDLRMPGMGGVELARCIKQDPGCGDVVVVALTASAAPEDRASALAAGCAGYLIKPLDTQTLGSTLRGYLERTAASRSGGPAVLPGWLPLSDPELEGLRRRFLEEGIHECRRLLESAGAGFDASRAGALLHRWAGAAGSLEYAAIAESARALEKLLEQPQPDLRKFREGVTELFYAFSDAPEASPGPVPESVVEALNGKRIALVGFPEEEAERLCAAMERVGARPMRFHSADPPDCGPVRDCSLVMVRGDGETMRSPWLSPQSPAPPDQPLVLAGRREVIMAVDAAVQARAREFLIDGWQPEEALLRCSFALSRAVRTAAAAAAPAAAAPARRAGPPIVLVVDDDPVIRSVVRGALETYGMDCQVAGGGPEALAMIAAAAPDAAVLDVNMPGMDGYLVLAAIREKGLSFPVILLTARRHENDLTRGFTLGADDYMVKPFNSVELVARLKRFLKR
ncbi:MAG: response regulator [Acidobacteriia bacterium]|nr:response regulator [Terriglobia bacterium]